MSSAGQPFVDSRWAVHRVRCLQQVGDVVLVEQGHHPRGKVDRKPMIGQHLSAKFDVPPAAGDKPVQFGEYRRKDHRPGPPVHRKTRCPAARAARTAPTCPSGTTPWSA